MDRLSAAGLGILQITGAADTQKPHLEFMRVPLGEAVTAGNISVAWPIASIDGLPPRSPLHTDALERLMLAGLRDTSASATVGTGIHLLRHAPRDGPGSVDTAFDAVSIALLAEMGVSPAWLLLISAALHGDALVITDGGARGQILLKQTIIDPEPIMELSIQLEGGVLWTGEGIRIEGDMPETMRSALVGMPLRRVVGHPVLDRWDLTITEARGTTSTLLDVGHVPYEPLDWSGRAC